MKIVDLYESEFLTDEEKILQWMRISFVQFNPDKLTIEQDGLIYNGNLTLRNTISTTKLKVQFKSVTGYFYISDTDLISLEGCPKIVDGNFSCENINITNLKYCPDVVGGIFECRKIKIEDPKEYRFALYCEIGNTFHSSYDEINEIINTYSGATNRKYWPHAINLLNRVKL